MTRRSSYDDIEELERTAREIEQASQADKHDNAEATPPPLVGNEPSQVQLQIALTKVSPEPVVADRKQRFKALAADIDNFEVDYKPRPVLAARKTVLGTSSPMLGRNGVLQSSTPTKVTKPNLPAEDCGIDAFFRPALNSTSEPLASADTSPTDNCGIESFFRKKSPASAGVDTTSPPPLPRAPKVMFSEEVAIIDAYCPLNLTADSGSHDDDVSSEAAAAADQSEAGVLNNALRPGHVAMLARRFESSHTPSGGPAVAPTAPPLVQQKAEVTVSPPPPPPAVDADDRRPSPKRSLEPDDASFPMDRVKRVRNKWQQADETGQPFQPDLSISSYGGPTAVPTTTYVAVDRLIGCNELAGGKHPDVAVQVSVQSSVYPECSVDSRPSDSEEQGDNTTVDSADDSAPIMTEDSEDVVTDDVFMQDEPSLQDDDSLDYSDVSSAVLTGGEDTPCQMAAPPPPPSAARDASKLRSVSSYRTNVKTHIDSVTPNKLVYKFPKTEDGQQTRLQSTPSISSRYVEKIQDLKRNECIQLEQIHQASRALNLCYSMFDYRGSPEELDAQKALLLANQKRLCIGAEINRIAASVRDRRASDGQEEPMGTLIISHVSVPLRMNFIRDAVISDNKIVYYFICLIKHRENVYATQMMSSEIKDTGFVEFSNYFQITPLAPDFELKFELYSLSCLKTEPPKQTEKKNTFTLNLKRNKTPTVVSRGGPGAVTDTSFSLVGSATINMANIRRNRFTFENMNMSAPVDGFFMMRSRCCPQSVLALSESGFLNVMNKDGSWSLFWSVLENGVLKCWRFPEDVPNKEPCKTIDLHMCVNAAPAGEEMTTRPRTVVLEMFDPDRDQEEAHSELVSADSAADYDRWLNSLNEVLRFSRIWGSTVAGGRPPPSVIASTAV